MIRKKFATAVNCIDGRTQIPVIDFIRGKANVEHVDLITEAGAAMVLARNSNAAACESIKKRISISIEKHLSRDVWVVAHHDCAANGVEDAVQRKQVLEAMDVIRKWFPSTNIHGAWVNKDWKSQEIGNNSG